MDAPAKRTLWLPSSDTARAIRVVEYERAGVSREADDACRFVPASCHVLGAVPSTDEIVMLSVAASSTANFMASTDRTASPSCVLRTRAGLPASALRRNTRAIHLGSGRAMHPQHSRFAANARTDGSLGQHSAEGLARPSRI